MIYDVGLSVETCYAQIAVDDYVCMQSTAGLSPLSSHEF